jgi:hypothetical protein
MRGSNYSSWNEVACQSWATVKIQQVVIGLAQEWGVKPLEVLRAEGSFLAAVSFYTCWARELFPQELVQAKIEEAEQLLRVLEAEPGIAADD